MTGITGNRIEFGSLNWKEIWIISIFFITFAYFPFLRNNELDELEYDAHSDNNFIFHIYTIIHVYLLNSKILNYEKN